MTERADLPVGVIIRTPPGSPSGELAVMTQPADPLDLEPPVLVSPGGTGRSNLAGPSMWDVRITPRELAQFGTSRYRHLRENIPFNRFISELLNLGKLPRITSGALCTSDLTNSLGLANSHSVLIDLPVERTWIPGPRLLGGNPSMYLLAQVTYQLSNKRQLDWTSQDNSWFLKWLDVSADFMLLRLFFSIKTPTVWAAYEELCGVAARHRRPTTVRVLFEIYDTMRINSSITADGVDFLGIAVLLRSNASGMLEIARRALESNAPPLQLSNFRARLMFAASRRDIAFMRLLVGLFPCCDGEGIPNPDSALRKLALIIRQVCVWEPNECKDGATLSDYIQLLIQGGILSASLSARCCYDDRPKVAIRNAESLTVDELVMLCPPNKRRNLYSTILPWSNDHISFVSKAGVFATAPEGSESLLQYLRTCQQNDAFEIHETMQECLLFAASLNDTQTASAMLQLGVDPQVSLLSNNQQLYHKGHSPWNPMIVAAAAGSLEILVLLEETANLVEFLKSAPVYEIIHLGDLQKYYDATGREICRLDNFRRHVRYTQTKDSDDAIANDMVSGSTFETSLKMNTWSGSFVAGKQRMETISWIRKVAAAHDMAESVDKEIIQAAMFNDPVVWSKHEEYHPCDVLLLDGLLDANLDYHEGDMDLLQLGIRAQCSLKFVELLLSKGLQVHSRAGQDGNTMLHDALLGLSRDRSNIVHLLLREGSEYTQCGEGLTVLEASLHGVDFCSQPWYSLQAEYVDIFTHLFEAGAPVRKYLRPCLEERQPLICRLIAAQAEDDLILRVIDAGANLHEQGSGCQWHHTPLALAILDGREKLARELVRRGADVHTPADGDQGLTALQAACLAGSSLEFVKYLVIVQGSNVNEAPRWKDGHTALQAAAWQGLLSVAEFLLDNGADINALSSELGYSWLPAQCRALDYAASAGRIDMVEFLLKAGGRSGSASLNGAIGAAKHSRHYAVVSVLLEWKKKHGRILMEEEAEWQREHPDAARLLSQP